MSLTDRQVALEKASIEQEGIERVFELRPVNEKVAAIMLADEAGVSGKALRLLINLTMYSQSGVRTASDPMLADEAANFIVKRTQDPNSNKRLDGLLDSLGWLRTQAEAADQKRQYQYGFEDLKKSYYYKMMGAR